MTFGSLDTASGSAPLAEINMVPLIDVMLVLLIVFMVTAPLLTHGVQVELPAAASTPHSAKPHSIQLTIDAAGQVYWNGAPTDANRLAPRIREAARSQPQPELHIRADKATPYQRVAEVMSEAARHGLTRIGFVTDPKGH